MYETPFWSRHCATILTDEKGIATFDGGAKVAYFRDPDGNTLSVAQAGRS